MKKEEIDEKLRIVFNCLMERENIIIHKQHKNLYDYVFNHIKNDSIRVSNKNYNHKRKGDFFSYTKTIFLRKYMNHNRLKSFLVLEDFGGLTRHIRKEKLDLLEEF